MPWLPMYADDTDMKQVLRALNADPDCGFLVGDGPRRWKAVETIEAPTEGRHCIWVHTGGPLPLLRADGSEPGAVSDPWKGWMEERAGADPTVPYFGSGHPSIVWLNVRTRSRHTDALGLSSFEWIGNHYRILGRPAPKAVEQWWQRLRRSIQKIGKRIPRAGPIDGPRAEIWALPSALAAIELGTQRAAY